MVTGPGPYYAPLADFDFDKARRDIEAHLLLPLQVARNRGDRPLTAPQVAGFGREARCDAGQIVREPRTARREQAMNRVVEPADQIGDELERLGREDAFGLVHRPASQLHTITAKCYR